VLALRHRTRESLLNVSDPKTATVTCDIPLGQQIGEPDRIVDVGIALGDVADVLRSLDDAGSRPRGHGAVRMYTGTRNKKK